MNNELDFLKNIYNLHGHHVEWAIIEETVRHKIQKKEDKAQMLLAYYLSDENMKEEYEEESILKLGLFIKGSRVYVGLMCTSVLLNGEYRCFGAKGLSCKTCIVW